MGEGGTERRMGGKTKLPVWVKLFHRAEKVRKRCFPYTEH